MQSDGIKEGGLVVTCPPRKRPTLLIYDVDRTFSEEDLKEEIYVKNLGHLYERDPCSTSVSWER